MALANAQISGTTQGSATTITLVPTTAMTSYFLQMMTTARTISIFQLKWCFPR